MTFNWGRLGMTFNWGELGMTLNWGELGMTFSKRKTHIDEQIIAAGNSLCSYLSRIKGCMV